MTDSGYTLRVPVRTLGEEPLTGLESAEPIDVNGVAVRLRSEAPLLIVTAEPFPDVATALAFLPRVRVALWTLLLRWNIAVRADFAPHDLLTPPDPIEAGRNMARSMGLSDAGPVHGVAHADAVTVLPRGKRIVYLVDCNSTSARTDAAGGI